MERLKKHMKKWKVVGVSLLASCFLPLSVSADTNVTVSEEESSEFTEQTLLVPVEDFSVLIDQIEVKDPEVLSGEIWEEDGMSLFLTSVSPGDTEVRLIDANGCVDILFITVDETGKITVNDLIPWNGWNSVDEIYMTDGQPAQKWTFEPTMSVWYYFIDGVRVTGWFQDMEDNGNWYYLKETRPALGSMQTGWITDSTGWKHYYLDTNGRMLRSQWVKTDSDSSFGPAGFYYLTDDGAVQMNGWAESVTPGIYWYVRPNDGYFDINNPDCWSTKKLW